MHLGIAYSTSVPSERKIRHASTLGLVAQAEGHPGHARRDLRADRREALRRLGEVHLFECVEAFGHLPRDERRQIGNRSAVEAERGARGRRGGRAVEKAQGGLGIEPVPARERGRSFRRDELQAVAARRGVAALLRPPALHEDAPHRPGLRAPHEHQAGGARAPRHLRAEVAESFEFPYHET